jgi:hypothetical protein
MIVDRLDLGVTPELFSRFRAIVAARPLAAS